MRYVIPSVEMSLHACIKILKSVTCILVKIANYSLLYLLMNSSNFRGIYVGGSKSSETTRISL